MRRNGRKTWFPLLAIGSVVFIAIGIYMLVSTISFASGGVETVATVTRVEDTKNSNGEDVKEVYVEFTVGDAKYEGKLDTYVLGMSVGSSVPIIYKENNPADFTYGSTNYLPSIMFFVSGAMLIVFAVISVADVSDARKLKRMKEQQVRPIEATVKEFSVNRNIRVMGKHPATLVCSDYQGKTYNAKLRVGAFDAFYVGSRINVYIDRYNPGKYIIDTEDYLNKRK